MRGLRSVAPAVDPSGRPKAIVAACLHCPIMMFPLDRTMLAASWRSWYANDLRCVGPAWLQLLWTFIFGCALGTFFYALGISFVVIGSGR
jgi:hypothetical protein